MECSDCVTAWIDAVNSLHKCLIIKIREYESHFDFRISGNTSFQLVTYLQLTSTFRPQAGMLALQKTSFPKRY